MRKENIFIFLFLIGLKNLGNNIDFLNNLNCVFTLKKNLSLNCVQKSLMSSYNFYFVLIIYLCEIFFIYIIYN